MKILQRAFFVISILLITVNSVQANSSNLPDYQSCLTPEDKRINQAILRDIPSDQAHSEIDQQLFKRLAIVFSLFCHRAEDLWSETYRLDKTPILLVFRDQQQNEYGYLINHPSAITLPSAVYINSGQVLPPIVKLETLPQQQALASVEYFDFQFDIAGTPTYVMLYNEDKGDSFGAPINSSWDAYFVHEGLHHQQEGSWQYRDDELQDVKNYPLAKEDIAHILLETKTLLAALEANTQPKRLQAIKHFVAVRTQRMASDPIIKGMDATQERYEGTAHYLEHQLKAIIPNSAIPEISTLLNIDFASYTNRGSFAFGRFYATGATLSTVLDQLPINWKPMLESGLTHYEILKKYLLEHPANKTQQQLLTDAKEIYHYSELLELASRAVKRIK